LVVVVVGTVAIVCHEQRRKFSSTTEEDGICRYRDFAAVSPSLISPSASNISTSSWLLPRCAYTQTIIIIIMKFVAAAVLVLLGSSSVDAFSPRAFARTPGSSLLVPTSSSQQQSEEEKNGWRVPMNMVAGGAERAYGQEYYEGKQKNSE
jgi:hypothetical protein